MDLKFDIFTTQQHFTHCELDLCVYYKKLANGDFVIILHYIDDMFVVGTSVRIVRKLKQNLALCFSMKYLWEVKRILGMNIIRDRQKKEIRLSQEKIYFNFFG